MESQNMDICDDDEISPSVYEQIYNLDEKLQDDLELISLVEGNPRLYDKKRSDFKNVKDKEMAWESIGNALTNPMNGPDAKHRWDTLRNLYGRARRQLTSLDKENCLSGSGQNDITIENMLTPQSKAIHRFLGKLYVPRKTISNYKRPRMLLTPVASLKSPTILDRCSQALAMPSRKSAASVLIIPPKVTKLNESLTSQIQKASTVHTKQKVQSISQIASANSFQETPDLFSAEETASEATLSSAESSVYICNEDSIRIKKESENLNEAANKGLSDIKRPFAVPKEDIRKRKKQYEDTEIAMLESSKAITSVCSELPNLLQSNTVTHITQDGTEEDKAMATVLLQSLKQVPKNKRSRCMMKIFEVLQTFEEDTA